MTKTNLSLIGIDKTGTLETRENLGIVPVDKNTSGIITGGFDRMTGSFELTIPGLGTIDVSGIPAVDSMGYGPRGKNGMSGKVGESGTIKAQAETGEQGTRGKGGDRGKNGYRGFRGYQGHQGRTGDGGDDGSVGEEGHIPMFIQGADPGSVPPGTVWVKRISDIKRDAVNIAAPVLLIDNVTVFLNEDRIARVRVSNSLEDILRYEVTPDDDTYIEEIINPVTMESLSLDPTDEDDVTEFEALDISTYDFLIKLKDVEIAEDPLILDRKNYTTTIQAFIESSSGSDTKEIVLTVLPNERT